MARRKAEQTLEMANRRRGQQGRLEQAKAPVTRRMARGAAKAGVERSFAMPLRAAGGEATVVTQFADEAGSRDPSQMDRSRRVEDVLGERQAERCGAPIGREEHERTQSKLEGSGPPGRDRPAAQGAPPRATREM